MLLPAHNLPVGIMSVFCAEWRPANETLEHDCSHGPPIATERIPLPTEDLGCNVVGRANCGVSKDTSRLAPSIYLGTIADSEIYLVQGDGLTIFTLLFV